MKHNFYIYLLVMGISVFAIRVLPLMLIRKPIKNCFIRDFLYYGLLHVLGKPILMLPNLFQGYKHLLDCS